MRKLILFSVTCATLIMLALGTHSAAVLVANGNPLPTDPWDVKNGNPLPTDPWDVKNGNPLPTDPWDVA